MTNDKCNMENETPSHRKFFSSAHKRHMTETILQPEEIKPAVELANRALAELDRILLGRSELHRLVFAGVLSRGHILLEGLPGVGKTALVKALGGLFNLQFNRVQFTPDLMPSDILGAHILQENHDG